jgi:hypothetical protein
MTLRIARIGLAASAIMVAGAGPLVADVTITMASKSPAGDVTSTASIKGMKMREDSTVSGGIAAQFGAGSIENTRIVKLDERETINISSFEKRAIVQGKDYFDKVAKDGVRPDQPKIHIRASGQTRQIAGQACEVHDVEASIPLSNIMPQALAKVPEMQLAGAVMTMKGTACLASGAPGWADYKAFYAAASEFYRRAPSPDGPATVLIGAIAQKGIMYEMTMKGELESANGGAIPLLSQLVSSFADMSMRVTAISTENVPASRFEIPAGTPVRRISN